MSRESLLPLLAAHVLEHGLEQASLRPLAKTAGTSDRMLIYHFGSKERLIADVLGHLADTYSLLLEQGYAGEPATSRRQVLDRVLDATSHEVMQPFLSLAWEIIAAASRGDEAHRQAVQQVMESLLAWLERQMPQDDPDPAAGARYLLTVVEGALVLRAIGREGIVDKGLGSSRLD